MVVEINNENFEQEVLKSNKTVLIDFYAEWCGPCQMLSPIVEQVAQENDNIKVVKVNVDENQSIAVEFGIKAIPTLIVIKEGKEANRAVGMLSKTELLELIK